MQKLLLPLLAVIVQGQHPLTLSPPRTWGLSPHDAIETKITTVKLSPESQHLQGNVSFSIEPSYHQDVSKYFRIQNDGAVYLKEKLPNNSKGGFLQVVVRSNVEGVLGGRTEVRVVVGNAKVLLPVTTVFTTSTTTEVVTMTTEKPLDNDYSLFILVPVAMVIGVSIAIYFFAMKKKKKIKPTPKKTENKTENEPTQFPRHHLTFQSIIGEGHFGQVWKCTTGANTYAVKTLKNPSDELQKEFAVMQSLDHPHVVKLVGGCFETTPHLLILEFVAMGKLQSYLRDSRTNIEYNNLQFESCLSGKTLTSFCLQVAKGMDYLSGKNIIHRDLAARNVLLAGDCVSVKVADFGFAKDVQDVGIYERKSDGRLPIRWLPPESLFDSIFSTASDVWSFGIFVWECVTLGSTPYPGHSPAEVMRKVRQGYRLEKPAHCRRELYNIMFYCWNENPADRPSFGDLVKLLSKLLADDEHYIMLEQFPEHCYVNLMDELQEVV